MPNISVVIPYYNDSKHIEQCITSVISQTLTPLEIIIIDDCSIDTDGLRLILNKFNFFNIKLFRNNVNMNGAYSRNRGIHEAKGDFIALLDADDFWSMDHLEKNYNFIFKEKADFVYSQCNRNKKNKLIKRKVNDIHHIVGNIENIILYSPPQTNSFFFSSKISPLICFDEKLKRHQDYQFFLDIIRNKNIKVSYLDQYTTYYRYANTNKENIDYSSIFNFWNKNKEKMDKSLLKKKLWNIIAGGLRNRKINPETILFNKDLDNIFYNDKFYNFTKKIKNKMINRIIINIYFYIVIDRFKKLLHFIG
uniref:Gt1 n=3 Tax=Proteus mirabilis TaxID=584 RepID=A0A385JNB0_PROMI|nr:gt1 [Proteus mirabilis]